MEKPILFSTPMVIAIDENRKGQTRRIIKSKHESGLLRVAKNQKGEITEITSLDWNERPYNDDNTNDINPKYNVGDILWVRETWAKVPITAYGSEFIYKADFNRTYSGGWKPSIFMPKDAARFFIEVTKVRIERLQDISEEDAIAEGLYSQNFTGWGDEPNLPHFPEPTVYKANKTRDWSEDAIGEFQHIWESINGKESWNENPFVFVYEFKKVEKPKKNL